MKKFILVFGILALSYSSQAQTCEEREGRLLEVMGTLSAGFLYNTYALLGAIADGHAHDAFSNESATDILNAQIQLAENITGMLEKTIREKAFKEKKDEDYITSCITIIKGLKSQADYLVGLVKNNSQKNTNAYEDQRKKNWKDLSKLMGIPE
jgi:hypothetical protein